MRTALIVTITEGIELQPAAAFASAALRAMGFDPRLLPTDFCTTQDAFQTAVRAAAPDAVVFIDALEWREVLATLAGFACGAARCPVVVLSAVPPRDGRAEGFDARVVFCHDGALAALGAAVASPNPPPEASAVAMDLALFGGRSLLRRAMGCSLFAEPGIVPLMARRAAARDAAPTAALARLEAPVAGAPVILDPGVAARAALPEADGVEWWDRDWDSWHDGLLRDVARSGKAQTVRMLPATARPDRLAALRTLGVRRVVFECDALDARPGDRLPGAAGAASEVRDAIARARDAGLRAGVLLVIGLPGESEELCSDRCRVLEHAAPEDLRVVPFEPAGGTPAYGFCVARGWWPPRDGRWMRELYQPLVQPEAADYPRVLERALFLLAVLSRAA